MSLKPLADHVPPWDWDDDHKALILDTLVDGDADASERTLAAEMAGSIVMIDDEIAEILLQLAADTGLSDELRAACAISLGPALEECSAMELDSSTENNLLDVFGDESISKTVYKRIQAGLYRLYEAAASPLEVQRRALEASIRAPEDWHEQAVSRAWQSNDPRWQLTAVFCMGWIEGFHDETAEALDSDDPEILEHALRAAGNKEIQSGWRTAVSLAVDVDTPKPLRLAAIEAVAAIRPQQAYSALEDLLYCGDEEIEQTVEEALDQPVEDDDDLF